jgi:hypothetical protein
LENLSKRTNLNYLKIKNTIKNYSNLKKEAEMEIKISTK